MSSLPMLNWVGLCICNLAEDRIVVRPVDTVKCDATEVKKGEFEILKSSKAACECSISVRV